jgi:crotonobetainyl-CoA:carnitine CoA-transferase CaiB-like acyl-CoA transferase
VTEDWGVTPPAATRRLVAASQPQGVSSAPIDDDAQVLSHDHLDRRALCRHAHPVRPVGKLDPPIRLSARATRRRYAVIEFAVMS